MPAVTTSPNTSAVNSSPADYLDELFERLDEAELQEGNAEVDMNQGIITIESEYGDYVINTHGPTGELWLSSPLSGAHHFAFMENNWRSTKDETKVLAELLVAELGEF